jgi:hypothetical protein
VGYYVAVPAHNSVEKVYRYLHGDTSALASAHSIRHKAKYLSIVSAFAERRSNPSLLGSTG